MDAISATFQDATLLGVTVLAASGDQYSDCHARAKQLEDGRLARALSEDAAPAARR